MTDSEGVTLNDERVTKEQLEEKKKNLPKNQRIVEVKDQPGSFKVLTRLQD